MTTPLPVVPSDPLDRKTETVCAPVVLLLTIRDVLSVLYVPAGNMMVALLVKAPVKVSV